ncbi:alpha/beta hydrolase [Luxibacter massiliensis]|uniref:alpha/beta hydrolase n=1 Tax=Luxibacter massiliensis TaxID=2219695 RepID=UPI000F0629C8|nr:alpha/beta hydrolase [Luxibacter massiliensis]
MAINHTARKILKALSFDGIEVEASRHLADLKRLDPMKIFYKTIDYKIYNEDFEVPTRIFFPNEKAFKGMGPDQRRVMLFIHGGGWVTESVDNYERICARLANATEHVVVSVDYRLAPENKFPVGLEDCYAVARAIFTNRFILNVEPEDITLIGDSAGGNLAAALSLMARDRGEFMPRRQILIYPAVNSDYTEESPFPSVRENGTDYLLTAGKMRDYIELYAGSEEDKLNPYFAPILAKDVSGQPDTLVITAEFDPLRDEGEAYALRLKQAGNRVEIRRIQDALHGYFALGIKNFHVQESFDFINRFLKNTTSQEV